MNPNLGDHSLLSGLFVLVDFVTFRSVKFGFVRFGSGQLCFVRFYTGKRPYKSLRVATPL